MEDWAYEFKKGMQKIAKSSVHSSGGFVVGTVVRALPEIVISIGDDILLDKDDLVIANQLYVKHIHQAESVVGKPLTVGDQVILIPDSTGQRYALIDRVGV